MLKIISIIFLIFLLALGLSFSSLNVEPVQLDYYFGSSELPLSSAIIIAVAVGAIFGLIGSLGVVVMLRYEIMRLKKSVKSAERELTHLRAIPAKENS
jgi:putative membrane protein